jgi:hypothetical protein
MNEEFATVSYLCPLSAQDNPDNIDDWKNANLPLSAELLDFSVSYWFLMLYSKV